MNKKQAGSVLLVMASLTQTQSLYADRGRLKDILREAHAEASDRTVPVSIKEAEPEKKDWSSPQPSVREKREENVRVVPQKNSRAFVESPGWDRDRSHRRYANRRNNEQRVEVMRQPQRMGPRHDNSVWRNVEIVRHAEGRRRVEVVPNRTYWHRVGSNRYAHRYYGGHHWYGFHDGPRFYWTRYHHDRWWWFDSSFHRWLFWWEGFWWWTAPGGTVQVYVNNTYDPYDAQTMSVPKPDPVPAPADADVPEDSSVQSSDGRRSVEIVGPRAEAFLYDISSGTPVFMTYLANNVEKARFTENGTRLQILLDFQDGHFAMFSAEGKPFNQ